VLDDERELVDFAHSYDVTDLGSGLTARTPQLARDPDLADRPTGRDDLRLGADQSLEAYLNASSLR
jgi:hypothetical protein